MPELNFKVTGATAVPFAAAPMLNFSLDISNADPNAARQTIHAVALRCQVRIEPARRKYTSGEQEQLTDLFGPPARWGQTLKSMLWAHAAVTVPPFTGNTTIEMPVPCSYDFNIAANKFFYALEEDEAPLTFLFSGTVFYAGEDGAFQVDQISWEKECAFRLPVATWRQMMEIYYPNSAWLCLRKDVFDALYQYKSRHSLTTWETAIEKLLARDEERVTT